MNALLLGILGYVLIQLAIGVLVSRGIKNEADYLLAGRRIGVGLATFSIFATWFGAETVVGAAGSIYTDGLAGGASDPFGYGACLILMGLFFAMPLWRRGLTTFADLFRQRYSINIERLAVLLIVPTSVMWAAAQIRAFGQVITASSDIDLQIAISIATGVVIVYTVAGGLLADVYTDFFQGIAMILGLVVLFVMIIVAMGGLQPAFNAIEPARLNPFGGGSALGTLEAWAIPICGSVLAQELIARVLAVRSPQMARRASLLGGGLYLSFGLIPAFIGLVGITLLPGLEQPEQLLPLLAQQHLSTFFYILFAGALISAILSTVDSALLAAAALVSHNLIVPARPGMSEAAKVRSARIGVLGFGVIAYVLALHADSVYGLVEEASAFGSAGVFTVALFALFTSFGGTKSAAATLVVGLASWVLGAYVFELKTPYLVSLLAAFLTYVLVALVERRARAVVPEASTL
jgi:SSS family transporter